MLPFLEAVIQDLQETFGYDALGIRAKDEYGNLPFVAHRGYPEGFLREERWLRVDDDECLCTRMAREDMCACDAPGMTRGGSFHSDDLPAFLDSRRGEGAARYRDACRNAGFRSLFILPLAFRSETIGVMHLAKKNGRGGGGGELESLEALAPVVAESLYHYRLEERLRRNNDLLRTMNSLLELSLSGASLEEILARSLDLVLSIPWLSFESRGAVFLADDREGVLEMKAERGLGEEVRRRCALVPFGTCLCGRAAAEREAAFSASLEHGHHIRYRGIDDHGHYCVPILSPGGEVLGVLNIYTHSDHRRSEEEMAFLRSVSHTLAGIIMRHRAERELVMNEEQLRDFLVLAAHELRHPITIISGYAHLLKNYRHRLDEGDLPDILSSIHTSTHRLTRIVDELLDVSRVEALATRFSTAAVEAGELVEAAVEELRCLGHRREIVILDPGEPITVMADKEMAVAAILELLDNAVKFSPAGQPIEVALERGGGMGMVSVLDRGRGVPEAFRERIFERFVQVEDVLHHTTPGLGLGLHTARRVAEGHGGTLDYRPREGGGSVFTLSLPLAGEGRGS